MHTQDPRLSASTTDPTRCTPAGGPSGGGGDSGGDSGGATRPTVVVIGGGLAGLAASIRLADQGQDVTLIETRKRLGGRATSFSDPETGLNLDNCQHVLMGCCTNLLDLYRRLGVVDRVRWHGRLFFTDGSGVIDRLQADDLPAPVHLGRALLGFRGLSVAEKTAIARGMLAMIRLGPVGRRTLHGRSFLDWLTEHRQPLGTIEKFWSVIVVSALNEEPARLDAGYAVQVFQEGFLAHEQAYVMGLSSVPLVELYDRAGCVITEAGGRVMLGTGAERFTFDGVDGLNGPCVTSLRLAGGRAISADRYISALPPDRLAKLCPADMVRADPRLGALDRIGFSPIIGIHLWFDLQPGPSPTPPRGSSGADACRPVMAWPHLILTRSPLQWVFNKGFMRRVPKRGFVPRPARTVQYLHGVISAAHGLVDQPAEQIIDLVVRELQRALPRGWSDLGDRLLHARVIKEKRATFSARPGIDAVRPPCQGLIRNLFLAGDWCRTGWPATMEGAVRSGYLAASTVMGTTPSCLTVPDLPGRSLYRWLSGSTA